MTPIFVILVQDIRWTMDSMDLYGLGLLHLHIAGGILSHCTPYWCYASPCTEQAA